MTAPTERARAQRGADGAASKGGGRPRPGLLVRGARPSDLGRVQEVERASFSMPWGPGSFRSLLGLGRVCFVVAEFEGRVVGHGVLWWVGDEGELANLAVDPAERRSGIASAILDHLLDHARRAGMERVFLEVRVSNDVALRLYRSRGFEEVGVRRGYYRRPREDARILRLRLGVGSRRGGGAGGPHAPDPHDTPGDDPRDPVSPTRR